MPTTKHVSDDLADKAKDLAHDVGEKVKETLSDTRDYVSDKAQQAGEQIKHKSSELMKDLCHIVQNKPLLSVAIAACVGAFVICL